MATPTVSAVLFAKDYARVAAFYRAVMAATVSNSDADHVALDCAGFDLVIHQIPQQTADSIVVTNPPQRRERGALRLTFPVKDIASARIEAKRLGGSIDDRPPPWAGADTNFYLGYDPEGNVFGVSGPLNAAQPPRQ